MWRGGIERREREGESGGAAGRERKKEREKKRLAGLQSAKAFLRAAALGLSLFAGSPVITSSLFILLVTLFSFLFGVCLNLCACMRALLEPPSGKIGHEL